VVRRVDPQHRPGDRTDRDAVAPARHEAVEEVRVLDQQSRVAEHLVDRRVPDDDMEQVTRGKRRRVRVHHGIGRVRVSAPIRGQQ
jgi:hypothetical protein